MRALNLGLYRLHITFFAISVAGFVLVLREALSGRMHGAWAGGYLAVLLILVLATAHWFAARGAKNGHAYGRVLSRVVGTIWLIGIPIGTCLGYFVWKWTGKRHWQTAPTL